MTEKQTLKASDLGHFTGTENWYSHGLVRNIAYTDGVQYLAEHGKCYWLIDEVALNQGNPKVAAEEFQVWDLAVKDDHSAVLTCDDGNGTKVFTKRIDYTDFPLKEIRLYFCDRVILLPSEY